MNEILLALRQLAEDPSSNFAALGTAIAIVVLAIVLVALVLIAYALPAAPKVPSGAPATRRRIPGWARVAVFLALVGLGIVLSVVVWYQGTSSDLYCTRVCHAMADPAQTHKTSAHATVMCTRCHEGRPWATFTRGVAARSYSLYLQATGRQVPPRPLPDERCLNCHRTMLTLEMTARNGEQFRHEDILGGEKSCVACHGAQGHVPPRPR